MTPQQTGDERVDGLLGRMDDLDGLDLPAQLEVFTELQASLAAILDEVPGDAPAPR